MSITRIRLAGLASIALSAPVAAQQVMLELVADGLGTATSVSAPPGDTRLFVTTNDGLVRVVESGVVLPTPFLDLTGDMSSTFEGLLGMTFHPDYDQNGKFYVVYFDALDRSVLVQYQVSADPNVADPASAQTILGPFVQPGHIHNWNCLKFGPDGMLYVSTGDGGGYHGLPPDSGNSQDLSNTQGKILRLDVDLPAPHIPPDNPYVGQSGAAEEIWVYGLRQPWRFDFDMVTGDVFVGDVGQTTREELNFIPGGHAGGLNFGWACSEGTSCTGITGCGCPDAAFEDPILEYAYGGSLCCIIGGEVYRGAAMPALGGTYFYADFCSGRVWSLRYDGTTLSEYQERSLEFVTSWGTSLSSVNSFGEDGFGEMLVLGNAPSALFRVVPAPDCGSTNYCVTAPNSEGPGAVIGQLGTPSFVTNDLVLEATGAAKGTFGLFFYGPNMTQTPLGDGFLCVGGTTQRINPPQVSSQAGIFRRPLDLQNQDPGPNVITPGSSWNFQCWYRDPNGPGGAGFNLSDAMTTDFCP